VLIASFLLLGTGVVLGSTLAVLYLRTAGAAAPPWLLSGLHGFLALGGFGCLLLATLGGPERGLETGTASFGAVAAVLIALAAVAGSGILVLRLLKKRLTGLLIGVHATLAVSGFIFLTAYIFVG
jgi:hypothetical protein